MRGVDKAIKLARKAIAAKTNEAKLKVQAATKAIDRAAQKGVLKRNTAARYKSRLKHALQATSE